MRLARVTPLVTTAFVVLPGWASPASRVSACRWANGGRGVERGVLRGDVDGDGRPDTVSIVARYRALPIFPSCTVARVRHL